ncbi:anti-sigma factor [Microbacterium sp. AZCO]|uniref:anti-sigma factor n=1 Tax=Microbacterium sp. AZCO TaxID=3142976 RepID=UPI0031F34199
MSHLDPEQLALIALGEPVASDEEREHLATCADCRAEVSELTHAVVVARATVDETVLDAPPARVWDGIVAELGLTGVGAAAEAPASRDPEPDADAPASLPPEAPAEAARPRRRSRWIWALAASLALVLAIGAGVWVGIGMLRPEAIATAALAAFPDHPHAEGTAVVDESRSGERTLTVTLEGDAQSSEYREVWLIRNDGGALISLGVLEGRSGSFAIPDGVDLSQYDLVDISFEPVDGNPAHSGDSIVRGRLTFA